MRSEAHRVWRLSVLEAERRLHGPRRRNCLLALVVVGWLLEVALPSSAWAVPDPSDAVIYEVNLRAFSQAGDLAGVTARLDDIQALGANVLWLMPIHPIGQLKSVGQLGSPYSVRDYGAVSSEYGTEADLVALVSAAHERGMSVLMDWVANHTAWDNPWITAHPDWYTRNAQGQIISPPGTNWTDVADLNYDNPAMRSAMIGEMQYWVAQVGIDGFRADAADFVPRDFWQQAIPAVRASTDRPLLMLAEGARTDHYNAGFDLTWSFGFYDTLQTVFNSSGSAKLLNTRRASENAQIPAGKSILRFTTNHDESAFNATPPDLFGGLNASQAAYAAVIAYGGTPLVYNGQEIGWSDNVPIFSKSPLDWSTGQETLQWYARLLHVRQAHPALQEGTFTDRSTVDVAMVQRQSPTDQVLVLINTRGHASTVTIPDTWQGEWFDQFTQQAETLAAIYTLDPYQVLMLSTAPLTQGDFDFDRDVDGADLLKWQRGESPVPSSQFDFMAWKDNFGSILNGSHAALTRVPEPTTTLMFWLSASLMAAHSWRLPSMGQAW